MAYPSITAGYAALLGLIFAAMSAWVISGRFGHQVLHGDGGLDTMNRRIRAHANFAEYVPLTMIVVGLLEAAGAGGILIHVLLLPLTVARVLHPFGMIAPLNSLQQLRLPRDPRDRDPGDPDDRVPAPADPRDVARFHARIASSPFQSNSIPWPGRSGAIAKPSSISSGCAM